ncbi:MAG: aspartate carbamoyltransferase [Candidatus Nitrosocosmicus sp.]|jgi:aspartate carbamoyltransferase catalytic subunit|uniref:aspartate carbamoyltransferase n=1 Tax=Candidatus Nitrosocosmicus agrestis TaxID=2563600 RepID=UPI00122DD883|nr:aspartate carbamoyltransferase [Candidatus Nitrosocosmicus sp. SS]KAA2279628.1 aspartate carbamoyltransferase [Candidatus Nitrosocosmicus sp. SS]KAF0868219.1 aspartate carbamoyltransferase [Candidatus Nitrosocosmicus sp. SS]MDR4489860.1 aspartate carbamoyltransferase [Candidatus Nitrosocosmicus sp.]HET6588792.1 aspartate carbamoyltransferase [Candidatus Nitrosocosmicus sp.]
MAKNKFFNRNVVSIRDFNSEDFSYLFDITDKIQTLKSKERGEIAKGLILGYVFYEYSTRTRLSFESAMASIGGRSLGISDVDSSSIMKGESYADTVKTISLYSDVVLVRHPSDGSSRYACEISDKPVINGGSGSEEHPTQAMLDIYTIFKEKKKIDGLSIGIIGDLKYGRTVYSLIYALSNFKVNIHLISPEILKIRDESIYDITNKVDMHNHVELSDELLNKLDVIYVTRIQRERFPDLQEYNKIQGLYTIDEKILAKSKSDISILHPLPRVDEISPSIDSTPNALYFKQASYGKELRAALLSSLLHEEPF